MKKTSFVTMKLFLPTTDTRHIWYLFRNEELLDRFENADDFDIRETITLMTELLLDDKESVVIKVDNTDNVSKYFPKKFLLEQVPKSELLNQLTNTLASKKNFSYQDYVHVVSELIMPLIDSVRLC